MFHHYTFPGHIENISHKAKEYFPKSLLDHQDVSGKSEIVFCVIFALQGVSPQNSPTYASFSPASFFVVESQKLTLANIIRTC